MSPKALHRALACLPIVLLLACSDDAATSASGSTTTAISPGSTASARPSSSSKPAEAPADGVDLLKMVLTSAVKNKEPADVLDSAKPGQRVYGHITVRNRTAGPKRVSLSFRVNGDERSLVDLNVEKSWSWRTWAYVTLRKEDKGELTVHAFDDRGAELGTGSIPIR